MEHLTIYREPGRYAGWPANYGIWSWGDEIVVGFTVGYHKSDAGFHARDSSRPFEVMQARSLDGGRTWETAPMPCRRPGGKAISADEHMDRELHVGIEAGEETALGDCPGGLDFTSPDFALMCARTSTGAGALSWFYASTDRCHTWDGPWRLPMFGQAGIAARTDYLVEGPSECLLFLTATKLDSTEGRPFCARMADGGASVELLSWIDPEPVGYAIMPASVRLPGGRILVGVRCRAKRGDFERDRCWIDLYASDDEGASWQCVCRPVADTGMGGNPPTLTRLHDGRLCMTYGYRSAPHGMRAVFSEDDGATWGDERVLRAGAGSHDIGYPRTVQRPDGAMVTAYYWCDEPDGERYIGATIWRP